MLGSTRRSLSAGIVWASLLSLAAAELEFLQSRGPIRFAPPRTVYSNGHPAQRAAEPYLVFLRDVARALPDGASVRVRQVPAGPEPIASFCMAIGQLPRQRVVSDLFGGEAEYEARFGDRCPDAAGPVRCLEGGTLLRSAS